MTSKREFEILNWEQEIIRAEKTIQAVCEAYVGRPDECGLGQMYIDYNDIKHRILLEAETIRRAQQEERINK
jgi:hypothetical protein